MIEFIQETPAKGLEDLQGSDDVRIGVTKHYIQTEFQKEDTYFTIYIIPNDDFYYIAMCWGAVFDDVGKNFGDSDYKGKIKRTWPKLAELIVNGINDKYSNGALIRLRDFDDGDIKWYLTTIVGNIDVENVSELLDNEKILEKMKLIINLNFELMKELKENSLNTKKELFRDLLGVGVQVAASILLGGAAGLVGGINGDDTADSKRSDD